MQLGFSPDQRDLFDAFEQFFSRESSPAVVRRAEPLGFDAVLWRKLEAMEVWGSGASLSDLCVIAETAGRWIAPVPFVEHAVASRALGLDRGSRIATLSLRAATDGVFALVPAGAIADIVVGVDGDRLVSAAGSPPMLAPRNHADAPIADRAVAGADVEDHGDAAAFATVLAEWKVLTAATLVGVASRSLELAVQYVRERHQFGVPIGSFQAVQHLLADLPGLIDGARLLVHEAAAAAVDGGAGAAPARCDVDTNDIDDPVALASMAFLFAAETAAHVTDNALHVHGGYGFAEEYDIQLYYRRARGWALILGDPGTEYQQLAGQMFTGAS